MPTRAEVDLLIKGAEESAQKASRAMRPWIVESEKAQAAFSAFGGAVGSVTRSIVSDLGHIVTAGGAIGFGAAITGMLLFEQAASKLTVATDRSFGGIKTQVLELSEALKMSPKYLAQLQLDLGKRLYGFDYAWSALKPMTGFARAIGREPAEMQPAIYAFQQLGGRVGDVRDAMQGLMSLGQQLGGLQGAAKLIDQFTALNPILMRTNMSLGQIYGMVSEVGKGLPPAMQSLVQQGTFGALGNAFNAIVLGRIEPGTRPYDYPTGLVNPLEMETAIARRMRRHPSWGEFEQTLFLKHWGYEGPAAADFRRRLGFLRIRLRRGERTTIGGDFGKDIRGAAPPYDTLEGLLGDEGPLDEYTKRYAETTPTGRTEAAAAAIQRELIEKLSESKTRFNIIDWIAKNPLKAALYGLGGAIGLKLGGKGIDALWRGAGRLFFGGGRAARTAAARVAAVGGGGIGVTIPMAPPVALTEQMLDLAELSRGPGGITTEPLSRIDMTYGEWEPGAVAKPAGRFARFGQWLSGGSRFAQFLRGAWGVAGKIARFLGPTAVALSVGEKMQEMGIEARYVNAMKPGAPELERKWAYDFSNQFQQSWLGRLFKPEEPRIPLPAGWAPSAGYAGGGAAPIGARLGTGLTGVTGPAGAIPGGMGFGGNTTGLMQFVSALISAIQQVTFLVINPTGVPLEIVPLSSGEF